jgi:hypothetical protein
MTDEIDPPTAADQKNGASSDEAPPGKFQDGPDRNKEFVRALLTMAAYQVATIVLSSYIRDMGMTSVTLVVVAVLSWLPIVAILPHLSKPRTMTRFDVGWARYGFLMMALATLVARLYSQ